MTQHTHSEYVEGCYRCDLGRDEVNDETRDRASVDRGPDPRPVDIAAQGIRIANARGAAECADAALAALESAGWRIVKLEQVGCWGWRHDGRVWIYGRSVTEVTENEGAVYRIIEGERDE